MVVLWSNPGHGLTAPAATLPSSKVSIGRTPAWASKPARVPNVINAADAVELHTGQYALARGPAQHQELVNLTNAGRLISDLGMHLHAGHGLNYHNVVPVARIPKMRELNIGHSIVSRAVLVGLERAVREMKQLIG